MAFLAGTHSALRNQLPRADYVERFFFFSDRSTLEETDVRSGTTFPNFSFCFTIVPSRLSVLRTAPSLLGYGYAQ